MPAATGILAVCTWWAAHTLTAVLALQLLGGPVLGLLATMLVEPLGRALPLFSFEARGPLTWWAVLGTRAAAVLAAVPERRWRVR